MCERMPECLGQWADLTLRSPSAEAGLPALSRVRRHTKDKEEPPTGRAVHQTACVFYLATLLWCVMGCDSPPPSGPLTVELYPRAVPGGLLSSANIEVYGLATLNQRKMWVKSVSSRDGEGEWNGLRYSEGDALPPSDGTSTLFEVYVEVKKHGATSLECYITTRTSCRVIVNAPPECELVMLPAEESFPSGGLLRPGDYRFRLRRQ